MRARRLAGTLRLAHGLIRTDARNLSRDALLIFLVSLPLPVALVLRLLLPELEHVLLERLAFELAPYHPMIMGVFAGMAPSLIGSVYGLMLVDERDERTLAVLRVMPVPFGAYLAVRLALPVLLAAGLTVLAYPLAGLTPLPMASVAAIAVSAATVVPVAALTLIAFAPNKVAGLALFRVVNVVLMLPVLAYIAAPVWQPLAWVVSSYWPMKALWLAHEGRAFALHLLAAPAMNAAMALWLYRRLMRRPEG